MHVEHGAMARRRTGPHAHGSRLEDIGGPPGQTRDRPHGIIHVQTTGTGYSGTVALKFYQFVFTINLFQFEWEYE